MKHTCHWTGCAREVPPAMWGCREHWFKLPKVLRDAVWRHYRPGQEIDKRPSDRYIATAALVQNWISGKVEIRKGGGIFLTGDIEVGGHTLPVGDDGRLATRPAEARSMDEVKRYRAAILPGIWVDVVQARDYDALAAELAECQKVRDQWCKEFTEQRDDANALVKRCAELERSQSDRGTE